MAPRQGLRRLVVNADDFGRSDAVNQAVQRAHAEGILTSASLMMPGARADEAVRMARDLPQLGVGLHLTLVAGRALLAPHRVPGLVRGDGTFRHGPVRTGWRFQFCSSLRPQIRDEVAAQFDRFLQTGLTLDHLNGHLHLHLHPVVLEVVLEEARRAGLRHVRLTRDPFWLNARLAGGRWGYRAAHAVIFSVLAARARPRLEAGRLRFTKHVFGLLQDGRMDEAFLLRLVTRLPEGDTEVYAHPSNDTFLQELDALVSPRVRAAIREGGIELVRYQDLP